MMVTLGPGGLKIIILHNCLYLRCRLGYLHVLNASKYLAMKSLVEPGLHMGPQVAPESPQVCCNGESFFLNTFIEI